MPVALLTFLGSFQALAQSDIYLCEHSNGEKFYSNTGDNRGCAKVDIPGIGSSKWVTIYSDKTVSVYFDKSTFSASPKQRKAWVMTTWAASQTENYVPYQSAKTLSVFRCADRTTATLQSITYGEAYGAGKVMRSLAIPADKAAFTESAPDTLGEATLNTICSFKKSG